MRQVPSRLSVLALAACSVLLARSTQAQPTPAEPLRGETWAATQRTGRGTLTVAYYYPLEGWITRDASKVGGVLPDVMEQFRSYLKNVRGADVTLRWVPYEGAYQRFYGAVRGAQGGVVGLAGTTVTEARRKEVTFGPPYFSSMPVLVTHTSVPDVTSRERIPTELAGFTAIAFQGTTLEAVLQRLKADRWPTLAIEPLTTHGEVVDRIARDHKTFSYLDLSIFWAKRKAGAPIKRHRVGDGPREDFAFIMPLGSDWQAPLAEFFAAGGGYRNSRAYRQLLIKHLGVELDELIEATGASR